MELFKDDFKQSITEMKSPNENPVLPKIYELCRNRALLGEATAQLTFDDYAKERAKFINALYKLKRKWFEDPLRKLILAEKVNFDLISKYLKGLQLDPITSKNIFEEDPFFFACNIIKKEDNPYDELRAYRFAIYPDLNKAIDFWLSRNTDKRSEAKELYDEKGFESIFHLKPTLAETISSYFTPAPLVPINQAVIDTVPQKVHFRSMCYCSSFFQSMANFYPLIRDLPEWSHPYNKPLAWEYKKIASEMAAPRTGVLDIGKDLSWPRVTGGTDPLIMLVGFIKAFGAFGLAANRLCGFAKLRDDGGVAHYFPPFRFFLVTPGMTQLEKLIMIGQLFITYISHGKEITDYTDGPYYKGFNLPPILHLQVIDSPTTKQYELYSFIMAQRNHVYSFVKRASGQWWKCNDIGSGNEMVPSDKVPITPTLQESLGSPQRLLMAFYLRVEQ